VADLRFRAERLLAILRGNPFQSTTPFEKLVGDLAEACSRGKIIRHSFVYQVISNLRAMKVIRMWTHYEGS
jgi:toxin YoeB